MKRTALILMVLFSPILFSQPKNGDENINSKDSELVEQLVTMVTSILKGEDYSDYKENISPEAYVINNNSYESIYEILSNSPKRETFIEGSDTKVGIVRLWIPNEEKNATWF